MRNENSMSSSDESAFAVEAPARNTLADCYLFWSIYIDIFLYFQARYAFEQANGSTRTGNPKFIVLDPQKPLQTADIFLEKHYSFQGIRTLCYYASDYYKWEKNAYYKISVDEIKSGLLHFAEKTYIRTPGAVSIIEGREVPDVEPFPVTPFFLSSVEKVMQSRILLPPNQNTPCWIGGENYKRPDFVSDTSHLVFGKSKILNLDTMRTLRPSPLWFNTAALDFDFDPTAICPVWDSFFESIFGDDEESKSTVMEFIGLCLTTITKFQKALFLVGPKRSGKGTIARIIEALIGSHNTAPQGTADFGQHFGFESLVGKTFAIVSDARFGNQGLTRATEKLLNIIGEDTIKVNRKFKDALHKRLQVKFLFLSNMVPCIPDSSGALPSRLIFVKMTKSFFGQEDMELEEKLRSELPGIFNLALKHLGNLLERGHFIQPESGGALAERMKEMSSPVDEFAQQLQPYTHPNIIWAKWSAFCEAERLPLGKKKNLWNDLEAAGYRCDFDAVQILEKIRQLGGEATVRQLRDCSRKFHDDSEALSRKLREMVKSGLLQVRETFAANNKIVEVYSETV